MSVLITGANAFLRFSFYSPPLKVTCQSCRALAQLCKYVMTFPDAEQRQNHFPHLESFLLCSCRDLSAFHGAFFMAFFFFF